MINSFQMLIKELLSLSVYHAIYLYIVKYLYATNIFIIYILSRIRHSNF